MAWLFVILAGIAEVAGVIALRKSEGFTRWKPMLWGLPVGAASFWLLSLAMKELPIGLAYGVWTGIGSAGTVVIGMLFFKEARDLKRIVFLVMVVAGIVGLRLTGADAH